MTNKSTYEKLNHEIDGKVITNEDKNPRSKLFIGLIIALILIGILFFLGKIFKKPVVSINLGDFIIATSKGYDGKATIKPDLSYDKLNEYLKKFDVDEKDYQKLKKTLENDIKFDVSKQNMLKNGDSVKIDPIIDEKLYQYLPFDIRKSSKEIKIKGLTPKLTYKQVKKKSIKKEKNKLVKNEADLKKIKEEEVLEFIKKSYEDYSYSKLSSINLDAKLKDKVYIYKVKFDEIINDKTYKNNLELYLLAMLDENKKSLGKNQVFHRIYEKEDNTIYEIIYDGFISKEDILDYLEKENFKDLLGDEFFKEKESLNKFAGIYEDQNIRLILNDDKSLSLRIGDRVFVGGFSTSDKEIKLEIGGFNEDKPISFPIEDGEVKFDISKFNI